MTPRGTVSVASVKSGRSVDISGGAAVSLVDFDTTESPRSAIAPVIVNAITRAEVLMVI
jgi:hypothetical protein